MPSDTNRKLALTAVRTGLGDVGRVILSLRRVLSEPGSGDTQPITPAADNATDHLASDTSSNAPGRADVNIQGREQIRKIQVLSEG